MRQNIAETLKLEWSEFDARATIRCTITIALLFAIGLAINRPIGGMLAASGAMTAGFGSFKRIHQSRIAPMLFASIGMCLSTFVGTLAGHSNISIALIAGLWGFCYGLLGALGSGTSWIGQQCVIAMLVASTYPVNSQATDRAILVLAGGLLQTLVFVALWRIEGLPNIRSDAAKAYELTGRVKNVLQTLHQHLTLDSTTCRYGLQIAITLTIATTVSRLMGFSHAYWVPMTTLLVLKQDLQHTFKQSLARIAGTFVGAGLATLIAATRPGSVALAVLVVIFTWLCYTFQSVNYAAFAACMTSYIVFLLAFAGLSEMTVVTSRTFDTAIGGMLALLANSLPLFKAVRKRLTRRHRTRH